MALRTLIEGRTETTALSSCSEPSEHYFGLNCCDSETAIASNPLYARGLDPTLCPSFLQRDTGTCKGQVAEHTRSVWWAGIGFSKFTI